MKTENRITELRAKIQQLIGKATEDNNHQKQILSFLFAKLAEVKELETIERLKNYPKFLNAYLVYKSISRGNYQPELAEQINFYGSDDGQMKFLEAISADVENFEKEQKENKISEEPTNEWLLIMLCERLEAGEIESNYADEGDCEGCDRLYIKDGEGKEIMSLDFKYNKIEPDRIKEFLEKYERNGIERTKN